MFSFPDLEPFFCSMSVSNCWFLTCIWITQEAVQVFWYSHLFKNFPQFVVIHTAGGQREELRPWQRSWGRRLGIRKGVASLRKPPVPEHLTPKPESVLCSHLHLWLYGGLSPITVSLGEGVKAQLQGNKNSWAWQECFSLRTPLKVI